jgi:hypothetical protein
MSMSRMTNIGGYVKADKGIKVTNSVAATINGTYVDRQDENSCTLVCQCGDASGSPTAQTVDCKLQHSTATGSGFADVTNGAITQITADDTLAYVDINMEGLNRYIRAVVTVAFTGGSTPAIPVSATIILGGGRDEPLA